MLLQMNVHVGVDEGRIKAFPVSILEDAPYITIPRREHVQSLDIYTNEPDMNEMSVEIWIENAMNVTDTPVVDISNTLVEIELPEKLDTESVQSEGEQEEEERTRREEEEGVEMV